MGKVIPIVGITPAMNKLYRAVRKPVMACLQTTTADERLVILGDIIGQLISAGDDRDLDSAIEYVVRHIKSGHKLGLHRIEKAGLDGA